MAVNFDNTLVIAISSRALFNLEEGHKIYTEQGVEKYCRYQIEHENEILDPGVAYSLVEKFHLLNSDDNRQQVEIVLISRNSADTGLRIFNSIQHYGLDISRAAFTSGESPYRYIQPFKGDLFLSADPDDVRQALAAGLAAATILPSQVDTSTANQLRIAFDGDAVLFSDEAEQIYQNHGLLAFTDRERSSANKPLTGGPFKSVLAALHRIQQAYPPDQVPIRTALITARSAPAHERVIRTLRAWNIRIDEAVFLGGLDKGEFLRTFGADIYFDDQRGHCESTRKHVATGHVPHGVSNKPRKIS